MILGIDLGIFQMLVVFLLIAAMLFLFATEKLPLELTSFGVICALLVFFHFFPVPNSYGGNELDAKTLLSGFANPALLTVLALLVLGEGLSRTGLLEHVALGVHGLSKGSPMLAMGLALFVVVVVSAFLNNIPVVVIFIPIMQALAMRQGRPPSRFMMPLSFAAILGGMTTLIGSSTNLLVSSAMIKLGEPGFSFFSFTIPGLVLVAVGMVYIIFIAPRLLPDRKPVTEELGSSGKQFKAQMMVTPESFLDGMESQSGFFPNLKGITVLMVQREEHAYYPPYDDLRLQRGDLLVVAATRDDLADMIKDDPTIFYPDIDKQDTAEDSKWKLESQTLAEVMVTPGSHIIGKTLEDIGFRKNYECVVLGIERRSSMLRQQVTEIPLKEGDVLLLHGNRQQVRALRGIQEFVLIEWSKEDLPQPHLALRAAGIFGGVILLAGTGILTTEVAALTGAALMVLGRVVPLDVAIKSLDRQIVFLIASALALGVAMEATGGAAFLSHMLLVLLDGASPAVILSGFFLLVAALANILSTKATAVLFTPIAVAVAHEINVPAEAFAVAVVFAANCSFASPVGYQTNLLVMTPGRYKFADFVRAGLPLILICWISFSLFAPYWYGLS